MGNMSGYQVSSLRREVNIEMSNEIFPAFFSLFTADVNDIDRYCQHLLILFFLLSLTLRGVN